MRIRKISFAMVAAMALPVSAQLLGFSLRTNNQQLIDEALAGAFVRISQSYELCDTVSNQHFGRGGKDYFSKIPYFGVETEKGLVFPSSVLMPWTSDSDFNEYRGKYKPLVTETEISILNNTEGSCRHAVKKPIEGEALSRFASIYRDSTCMSHGLKVDTVAGNKDGWVVWFSSSSNPLKPDSVRFMSIRRNVEVPEDGASLSIDKPEIQEPVCGGIYVIPRQTSIGQITFLLTGIVVPDGDGWIMEFPFIEKKKEVSSLTPIASVAESKPDSLKKKKKRK